MTITEPRCKREEKMPRTAKKCNIVLDRIALLNWSNISKGVGIASLDISFRRSIACFARLNEKTTVLSFYDCLEGEDNPVLIIEDKSNDFKATVTAYINKGYAIVNTNYKNDDYKSFYLDLKVNPSDNNLYLYRPSWPCRKSIGNDVVCSKHRNIESKLKEKFMDSDFVDPEIAINVANIIDEVGLTKLSKLMAFNFGLQMSSKEWDFMFKDPANKTFAIMLIPLVAKYFNIIKGKYVKGDSSIRSIVDSISIIINIMRTSSLIEESKVKNENLIGTIKRIRNECEGDNK